MKNPLRTPLPFPVLILLALMCLMASTRPVSAAEQVIDRIIATVNQNVITQNQLAIAMVDAKHTLQASGVAAPDDAVLRTQVLDQLINNRLELQAAKESGVTASEEDTSKAIDQVAQQNHLTRDELFQKLKAQGLDVDRWKKDIHDQLLIQKVQQQEVGASLSLSPDEVEAYTKTLPPPSIESREYQVRDYVIGLPDNASPKAIAAAKKQAIALIAELRAQKKLSLAHLSVHDFDWKGVNEMPSVFAKQIPQMKNGGVSAPIRTGNGFHVLQITGIRQAGDQSPILSPEEEAKQQLLEDKYRKGVAKWIAMLRSRATIHMNPVN